jgi:hypothetical protein
LYQWEVTELGPISSLLVFWLAAIFFWILAPFAEYFASSFFGADHGGEAAVIAFTISTLLICASLYELRRLFRTLYGLVELVFAVGLAMTVFIAIAKHGIPSVVISPFLAWVDNLVPSLTFLAAIYVGVRALDNIGEGLSPDGKETWDWFFPKREHTEA